MQDGYTKEHRHAVETLLRRFIDDVLDGIAASRNLEKKQVLSCGTHTAAQQQCQIVGIPHHGIDINGECRREQQLMMPRSTATKHWNAGLLTASNTGDHHVGA